MNDRPHASSGRAEVEPAVAPARRPDHVAEVGADDRRPTVGRSTSRDATSPTIPTGHGPWTIVAWSATGSVAASDRGGQLACGRRSGTADRRPSLAHRLARQVAPRPIGGLELGRQPVRLGPVVGQEQRRGVGRLPHPARGVDPRRDRERQRLERRRRPARPDAASRRAAIPGRGAARDPGQAEPDDRARLAEDRDEVGDAPDRREVGELERGGRSAGLVAEQQLGQLEGDAAARQPALGIARCRRAAD